MKVVWSPEFQRVYSGDPAAAPGRMEAVVGALQGWVEWVAPEPVLEGQILRCHSADYWARVGRAGLAAIAVLAAGASLGAARLGRTRPAFALVRPPGHHASRERAWGFCHLNNLAIALQDLQAEGQIERALVVDFDLHFGDGTADVLGNAEWATLLNPGAPTRAAYLSQVASALHRFDGDCIALSAGFDNHLHDWGGLLHTEDYRQIGLLAGSRARWLGATCFGVLEGGYNHAALGESVRAFLGGLDRGWQEGGSKTAERT